MPRTQGITIGELARRVGVTPDVLRAWERRYGLFAPTRTPGGYRLYSEGDERLARQVVALRDRGMSVSNAVAEVSGYEQGPADVVSEVAHRWVDAIDHGVRRFDEVSVHEVLDDAVTQLGIAYAVRDVVMPYLSRLGTQWESGQVTVAHEHFASHLIRRRVAAAGRQLSPEGRRTAVLACPPGERHDIGLLAYGVLLSNAGWSVRYLGADTPITATVMACESLQPDVVVLSATRRAIFRTHGTLIRMLARHWPVALAGAGATATAALETGATLLPPDIVTAVEAAERLARRPAVAT